MKSTLHVPSNDGLKSYLTFLPFVILLSSLTMISEKLHAQQTDLPCNIVTPWTADTFDVDVDFSSTGLSCWDDNFLCVILGDHTPDKVVDNNLGNFASGSIVVGGSLTLSVKDPINDYDAGNFAGFVISSGVLDLTLFSNIIIRTYLNNNPQETFVGFDLIGLNSALFDDPYPIGLVTTADYDEVEITFAAGLTVGTYNVHYAIMEGFCAGPALECNQATFMNSDTFPMTIDYANTGSIGLNLGNVDDPENAISLSTSDYASLNSLASVLDSLSIAIEEQVTDYPAGTFVAFDIENVSVLSVALLEYIVITTYLNGVQQEQMTDDDLFLGATVLNSTGRQTIGFVTGTAVDKIKFTLAQPIGVSLGTTRVYGAIFQEFCDGPALECNEETQMNSPLFPMTIDYFNTGSTGIGVGSVINAEDAISADTLDYASLITIANVFDSLSIAIEENTTDYPAGTFVGFDIENTTIAGLGLLENIVITTYLNGVQQEQVSDDDLLLGAPLLNSTGRHTVGFVASTAVDKVKFTLAQPINVNLGTTRVYSAIFREFCEGPPLPCNEQIALNSSEYPIYINSANTGFTGAVCLGCTIEDVESVIDGDPMSYAEIDITAGVATVGSISVRKELTDYPANTFAGFRIENVQLVDVDVLVGITISTYLDGSFVEFVTGTDILLTAGTDLLVNQGEFLAGFVTTSPFDEVRISLTNLGMVNIGTTKVYEVVMGAFCPTTIVCDTTYYLNTPEFPVYVDFQLTGLEGGVCALCEVEDPDEVITASNTDFASITIPVGVLQAGSIAVRDALYVYPPGTVAGFVIEDLNDVLQADLFASLTISTYLDGNLQELAFGANLIDAEVLILFINPDAGIYNVGFETTMPFDEVRITVGSLASVINLIDVYGAFVDTQNSSGGDSLNCPNPPLAIDDIVTTPEDTPVIIDVLDNDTDPDSPLGIPTVIDPPANGVATVNPGDSTITYTPDPDFVGIDSFTYAICDNSTPPLCDTATVVVTVTPVIDTIIIVLPEDSTYTVCADSLTTFTDPATSITLCGGPNDGTVTILGTCATYTPDLGFNGQDTFCLVVCDPNNPLLCDTTIIIVIVDSLNNPPVAVDDAVTTPEDIPVVIDVLDNDSDIDSPLNNPTITDPPANGTAVVNPGDGSVTYTPDPDFVGVDSFMYSICDDGIPILCDTALVIVTVTPVIDTIIETIPEDSTLVVCADSLTTFTDPATSIALCDAPSNGTVTIMGVCATYTPDADFTGQDTFCLVVCDPNDPLICDTTIVIVIVTPVNDPPVAVDDADTTPEDTPVVIDVLDNDSDIDSPLNNPTITDPPDNGTAVVNPGDGSVTYTPDPDFVGVDSFMYSICDDGIPILCDTALVIVTVTPVIDTIIETIPEDSTLVVCADSLTTFTEPATSIALCDAPSNGTVTIMGTCATYTPDPGFNGQDTFCVVVCDPNNPLLCDTTIIIVIVDSLNNSPVAVDDAATTPEDTPVVIDVLDNDSDPDSPLNNPTITDPPTNGTAVVNPGDGSVTYTPDPDFVGVDSFMYAICDDGIPILCDTALVIVTVTPVIDTIIETIPEDSTLVVCADSLTTFTDPATSIALCDAPSDGTVTIMGTCATYTPDPGFNGQDTFCVVVCDPNNPLLCDTTIVIVIIDSLNNPPVAVDDADTTPEDTPVVIDVLDNDSDPDSPLNNPTIIDPPNNGTAVVNPGDGSVTYTPDPDFVGIDSFTYSICDDGTPPLCDTALVIVTVTPANDGPIAVDDAETTPEDTPVVIDVLDNDIDIDSPLNNPTITDPPDNGTAMVNPGDGSVTYTPDPDFVGVDSFMYAICDDGIPVLCDTALVIVTVTPVIDTIVETIPEDSTLVVCADSLTTFTDPATSIALCDAPSNGTVTIMGVCATYTPDADFTGQDTFCVVVCDPNNPLVCDTTIVIVIVTPVNDPPVAVDDADTTPEDTPVVIDVLDNDSDIDSPLNNPTITDPPDNGTTVVNPGDGSVTYTPDPDFVGVDSFMYAICDDGIPILCDTALVIVTITPVIDTIIEVIPEDSTLVVCADSLTTFTDPATSIALCDAPSDGTVTIMGTCATYTPDPGFNGQDTFCVVVCDPNNPLLCDTTIIIVIVDSLNNPPVAVDDAATTPEDTPVVIDVLDNDSDPDSPLNNPTITDPPTNGTAVVNPGDGSVTYTPDPDFVGVDSFMYAICDDGIPILCDTALVIVTVTPVTDTITETIPEDSTLVVCADSLTTFTEPSTSIALCDTPSNGTVLIMGVCATYTPDADFTGQDTFCVVVCDPNNPLLCDTTIVIVIVTPVNDPPVAVDDTATTPEDTPVVIDVLDNDSDIDSPLNNPTITDPPTNGTVVVNPGDGSVTYTPDPDFVGVDSFMYAICDDGIPILCDTALVIVTVTPVIDTIIETIPEDSTLMVCADSLTTFTEPATSIALCDIPSNGTVTIMGVCATYTPDPDFTGQDTFCLVVCDPNNPLVCDTTIVIVIVTPVNDPPVAVDDAATTPEDTPVVIDVLDNDSDIDSPLNNPTITDPPDNGTVVVNPGDGTVTYTPDPDFVGVDSFMYAICDDGIPILCDTALVIVTVTPVIDTIIETIPEDSTLVICADSLTTFTEPATSISLCEAPSNGTVTIMGVCATYTPDADFTGQDTFCVVVCDPNNPLLCDTTIVIVIVTPVNDPPVAVDDAATTPEDTPVVIDVLDNDSDIDSPLNNPTITDPPTNGTAVVNPGDGTVTYTPDPDFVGVDSFMYAICDNGIPILCDTALVIVTVTPVIDTIIETIPEDSTLMVCADSLTTFTEPATSISLCDAPSNGTVTILGVCATYTPDVDFTGQDTFCVVVCDPNNPLLCDTTIVIVIVTPVNDPPVAVDDSATTPEDTPVVIDVLDNDSDIDSPLGIPDVTEPPSFGMATVNPGDSTITYTPDPDFVGVDSFMYAICDDGMPPLCDTALVVVTVTPVTDTIIKIIPEDSTIVICADSLTIYTDPASSIDLCDPPGNGTVTIMGVCATYEPFPGFTGQDTFCLVVCDPNNPLVCDTTIIIINVLPPGCVYINASVYLEGSAVNPNGQFTYTVPMRATLNDIQVLPGQCYQDPFFGLMYTPPGQPYNIEPWFYNGTEGNNYDSGGDPMIGDANYPSTMVDWVLVSLRDTPEGIGGPVCQTAAILHQDGTIEMLDSLACCGIDLMVPYYIVIEHRNHLIVMSDVPVAVNNDTVTYDFRNQQSYIDDPGQMGLFGAQKEILPGVYAMYAGNGNQYPLPQADTDINFDDRTFWEMNSGTPGIYNIADYNLNTDTNFNDRVLWEKNNGVFTSVPRD